MENTLPKYESPEVTTYDDQEILEQLGEARTSGSHDDGDVG